MFSVKVPWFLVLYGNFTYCSLLDKSGRRGKNVDIFLLSHTEIKFVSCLSLNAFCLNKKYEKNNYVAYL